MRKWYGGVLIIALAVILLLQYTLMGTAPRSSPHIGLDDLYALNNISKEDSKALLVWAHMYPLLCRSDALPETAQGIKEASSAWKDLWSAIEEDKASKFNNTQSENGNPEAKDCPFSVSTFDKTVYSSGCILEFPCGLVEDSSITVIGIPDGRNGSFQVELVGLQLPGERGASHFIALQWWGKEERCHAHASTNIQKVDGLVLCNQLVVRSTVEENLNMTHPNSDMLTNVSSGRAHVSANFPFAEGNPFTATLWVGSEGFHMTVNGRHETSFTYREKLEPWLVSGVKVAGGLELLSAFAKDLPVSEDLDLAVDVEHLKAPPVSRKRLVMLVGVFSTGNNFERRMALRRTWMQYEAVRSGDVAVRFFIGLHKNRQVNLELWREAQAYGDIQLMPFVDYYSLISLKTIATCIMGTKILPAKYVMKTDDDAFVRIDEVLSSLKGKPSNGLLYGLISFDSAPHRDKDSKWHISAEEWPRDTYPPWAHGPGYIISRDIAKFIVQGHQERDLQVRVTAYKVHKQLSCSSCPSMPNENTELYPLSLCFFQLFKLEDVAMGIWIDEFKNKDQQVNYISDERFYNTGCESNYILAHYQGPRKVLCLWEMLQKEQKPICCE
ncbi:Hydroxyproline O-galactosyltransferase GALT3 [Vitis vinifera]|uniref:Hydroxyproline O-galactosyltransferase GALT3 n=1 Tax=Vitis vinifera TaxID=29760 RepID=A0A438KKH0_VITVI|nr:Hydroxyproline O-galactosyltransferase GALT3 [Vitis vinifera]